MARGYLGKISAVVTVNTGAVKPGLDSASKDINNWARQTQSRISGAANAAGKALDGIFTPLQKVQAALKAASRDPLKLNIQGQAGPLLALTKAAEQIAKPLGNAQKQFTGLSQSVQAELLPVLQAAQKQTTQLFDAISSKAKVSERDIENTAARVERLNAVIRRGAEASQAVSGLASGGELRFQNPEFLQQANRAAALQQQAASLSPVDISSRGIVSLIGQQRAAADEAERLRALLDRVQATRRGDAAAAQAAYAAQLVALGRVNDAIEEQIGLAGRAATASREMASQRSAFDSRELDRRGGVLARRNANSFEDATAGVMASSPQQDERFIGRVAPSVDNVIGRIRELDQQYKSLPEAARAALEPQVNTLNMIANAARSGSVGVGVLSDAYERVGQEIESAANAAEMARASFVTIPGNPEGEFGPPRPFTPLPPNYLRDRVLSRADQSLGLDVAAPQRALDNLRNSIVSVKGQLDALPAAVRSQFIPAIQGAEAEFRRLSITPRATAEQIEASAGRVDALTASVRRAADASKILNFGDVFSQASSRQAVSELDAVQRVLLQVRATAGGGAAQAFDRLAERTRRAVQEGNAGLPRVRAELRRLQREAAEAAAATGRISVGRALQQISRAGDVGRAGLDRFQLAAQQAGFALDDFFSVTGGVEQRLRAVSNNISQLGFIIGGTAGLFTALGVTIGTQVVLAISKFAFQSDVGEAAAKAMSDTLKNQRDRVKELANAYKELAASIADSGMSEAGRRLSERSRARQGRERQAGDIALNEFALNSPSFALSLGQERLARERVQNAGSLSGATAAVRGERQAVAARAREERIARSRIRALADSTPISEIRRQRLETRNELARESARRSRASAAAVFTAGISTFFPGFETNRNRENSLRERLATQEGAIALGRQRQAESFVQRGQQIGDRLAPFQENVRGFTETQGQIDRILTGFAETAQKVADGALSPGEVEAATNELNRLASEAERVAISMQSLQGVLDRQVSQLADAFVSDLQNREEQLRRQANAAEARNDPAAAGLRRDEQDIIQARRRAEQRRQDIEEQVSRERQRFEQDLIAGRGSAEDRRRAEEIRAQREIIDSDKSSQAEKERARLRLSQLELEQSQSFEQRAGVQRLREQANQGDVEAQREIQRIESRQRGRDLGLTELEQRRRELRQQSADFGEAFRSGDINAGGVQAAARNLAGQMAPMLTQFRDEVLSARLQGPSRAALRVSDVNTAEGQAELNRLIRGEDSNRDVNLLELQNQSRLLQEIKVALESETNTVVDL
jgi:hypothetical protein